MFAVVEISGKQELVKEKDILHVLKVPDVKEKGSLSFDKVLLTFTPDGKTVEVGAPYLKDKKVEAIVETALYKGEKVMGGKFKRRKRYTRIFGHRQQMTTIHIEKVS
jgi:large subunit ribosomal protein L21